MNYLKTNQSNENLKLEQACVYLKGTQFVSNENISYMEGNTHKKYPLHYTYITLIFFFNLRLLDQNVIVTIEILL